MGINKVQFQRGAAYGGFHGTLRYAGAVSRGAGGVALTAGLRVFRLWCYSPQHVRARVPAVWAVLGLP